MKLRILILIVLGAVVVTPACTAGGGGGGGAGGLGAQSGGGEVDPIGAPDTSSASDPSVAKTAAVKMDVPKKELNSAAQAVVDLASADTVGGFLVSSVVDENAGYGAAKVVVKVPSSSFERVVADLHDIGNVSRHELEGQDLSNDFLRANARVRRIESRIGLFLSRLEETDDRAVRFELRSALQEAKSQRAELERDKAYIEGITTYSVVDVAIDGKRPPAPPEPPVFERSLATAKNISLWIGSALILAAGVIVPLGLAALVVYLLAAPIVRRVRTAG